MYLVDCELEVLSYEWVTVMCLVDWELEVLSYEWVTVMYLVDLELGSLMHCGLRVCVQQAIGEGYLGCPRDPCRRR